MVSVKVDVKKKDLVWLVPLVIVLVVGVVYAYGTSNPSVMGHSAEELEISWDDIVGVPEDLVYADDLVDDGTGTMQMKTGTYVGNGVDNRNIDIGVDLSSMTYKWMVIRAVPGYKVAIQKFGHDAGDMARWFSDGVQHQNLIQAWTSTGFQIGYDGNVNANSVTYNYVVFWQS